MNKEGRQKNIDKDLKYPECFKFHDDCRKCPNFGMECIEKIDEIDNYYNNKNC